MEGPLSSSAEIRALDSSTPTTAPMFRPAAGDDFFLPKQDCERPAQIENKVASAGIDEMLLCLLFFKGDVLGACRLAHVVFASCALAKARRTD